MKKKLWKEIAVLFVIFIVAVIFFSYFTNKGNANMMADMDSATYPKVSFVAYGYEVNSIPGYAKEMDVTAIRDTITPVINSAMELNIKNSEYPIEGIDYYVLDLDGQKVLHEDSTKVSEETAKLHISNVDLVKKEKVLKMVVHREDAEDIYYYTRIIDASNANLLPCLDYAEAFHKNAIAKAENTGIGAAIEPNAEGNNTTFQHVTIHSDYDHVSWGALEPVVVEKERWSIKELNNTYACIQAEYTVECKGEENESDEYKVKEFFKIRHSGKVNETYLLDYDRTMEQIFDPMQKVLTESGVVLGIVDENVSYVTNKKGTIVSFVQADELWSYNLKEDCLSLVFSFSSAENKDERNFTSKHDIKILGNDSEGNVTFAVSGYMNRGNHEGEVGIAVYDYNIDHNTVEEKTFIAYDRVTESEIYFDKENNYLYVMAHGTFYRIEGKQGWQDVLAEGLDDDQYVLSSNNNRIAYLQENEEGKQELIVKNLFNENERVITCADGEQMKPIGFIGSDFVYGVTNEGDYGKTITGEYVTPMYRIEIEDSKGNSVLSYNQSGMYILNAKLEDNMITLNRVVKDAGTYTATADDYITNNEEEKESVVNIETYVTELKQTQCRITFEEKLEKLTAKILQAKHERIQRKSGFELKDEDVSDKYYVYAHGEMYGYYDEIAEAVVEAKACRGVVVTASQECVWETANRNLAYTIPDENGLVASLRGNLGRGSSPMEAAKSIPDTEKLNLTGCKVEDMLYFINRNMPIMAMLDAQTAVILYGYNENTVFYINPVTNETDYAAFAAMDQMTAASGHAYIAVNK